MHTIQKTDLIKTAVIILFFFSPLFLSAGYNDQFISSKTHYYEEVAALYRESGQILPTVDQPWSYRQVRWLIDRLDISSLSPASRNTIDSIMSEFSEKPVYSEKGFSFDTNLTVKTEVSVPVTLLATSLDNSSPYPWNYRWNKRSSLIEFPLLFSIGDHIFTETLFEIMEEPSVVEKNPVSYSNVPGEAYDLYLKIPRTAYINAGGTNWDISFGRTRPKWGAGETGTLLLSGNADWMEGIRLRTYFDHFSYTWYTANLSPWFVTGTDPLSSTDGSKQQGGSKWWFGHSFEITLGKSLYLGLREVFTYGGTADLPLGLFNPVMVLHNLYLRGTSSETWYDSNNNIGNAFMSLDMRWAVIPGWEIYNSFILDQAQTPGETGGAVGYPAAWGNLGGIAWVYPAGNGRWESFLEGVYTNPWLYTHYQPETRYTFSRYVYSKTEYTLELPLGYETGPDTSRIILSSLYRVPGKWLAGGEFSWTREGSTSVYVTYPGGYSTPPVSPPGTPDQITWKAAVRGEKNLNSFTLAAYGAWLERWNVKDVDNNHIPGSHLSSLELVFSIKYLF